MSLWWLSFAGEEGNRGIAIVEGVDVGDAARNAHLLGCNPGGEVLGVMVPDEADAMAEVNRWGTNRLVTPAELRGEGYISLDEARGAGYDVDRLLGDERSQVQCEHENKAKAGAG